MSNAAWSSSDVTPLMTSGLDTFPVLSITNCTITRPSVCSSIAFCGYLRLSLMKESNASVPPGNSGEQDGQKVNVKYTLPVVFKLK